MDTRGFLRGNIRFVIILKIISQILRFRKGFSGFLRFFIRKIRKKALEYAEFARFYEKYTKNYME